MNKITEFTYSQNEEEYIQILKDKIIDMAWDIFGPDRKNYDGDYTNIFKMFEKLDKLIGVDERMKFWGPVINKIHEYEKE